MQVGNIARQPTVHLLRIGGVFVKGAQAGFDMPDLYFCIKGGKRGGKRGRGIAMYQDQIGACLREDAGKPTQSFGGDGRERLPLLHDIQVKIGLHMKNIKHRIKHFAVLCRHAAQAFDLRALSELKYERRHLDGFRPRAENRHDLNFAHNCLPKWLIKAGRKNIRLERLFWRGVVRFVFIGTVLFPVVCVGFGLDRVVRRLGGVARALRAV